MKFRIIVFVSLILLLGLLILFFLGWPQKQKGPFCNIKARYVSGNIDTLTGELLYRFVTTSKTGDPTNIPMISGNYLVYPIGEPRSNNSITAIAPPFERFPDFVSWGLKIDKDVWNFVWDDPASTYWATPILSTVFPIVVIKGQFPRVRYFSFYSYVGPEKTEDGQSLFGQPLKWDFSGRCEPSIPKDCAGFLDREIQPDFGSKNPFRDPTYQNGDPVNYTVYFVSPYYKGPLPESKNILPMCSYGSQYAILLYRIYAPFNPKDCSSPYYSDQSGFDRRGCGSGQNTYRPIPDGGSANPLLDKTSRCHRNDTDCYKHCIETEIAKDLASGSPVCAPYVGNNKFCVCDKDPTDPCAQYIDRAVRKCTNNQLDFKTYCGNAPVYEYPYGRCVNDYPCDLKDITLKDLLKKDACVQKYTSEIQQCALPRFFQSTEPACFPYKDPIGPRFCNLPHDASMNPVEPCGRELQKILIGCNDQVAKQNSPDHVQDLHNLDPYLFSNVLNGSTCKTPQIECYEYDERPYVKSVNENTTCDQFADASLCDRTNQRYQDLSSYVTNVNKPDDLVKQGWIDLPEVFIKYSYNNYFIRMNPWNFQDMKNLSIYHAFARFLQEQRRGVPKEIVEGYERQCSPDKDERTKPCPCISMSNACAHDKCVQEFPDECCADFPSPIQYFNYGASWQIRRMGIKRESFSSKPPFCQYYVDRCLCQYMKSSVDTPYCGIYTVVDEDGERCFKKWRLQQESFEYDGEAIPFTFNFDTGNVIPFPNPDSAYLGAPTVFSPSFVYIIWMDVPSAPTTPGWSNLSNGGYDVRYWSLGHYYWGMTTINQRPCLSGLFDQFVHTESVSYTDDKYDTERCDARRACFLLATYEQYTYLKEKDLLPDNVNWLNWGKLAVAKLDSAIHGFDKAQAFCDGCDTSGCTFSPPTPSPFQDFDVHKSYVDCDSPMSFSPSPSPSPSPSGYSFPIDRDALIKELIHEIPYIEDNPDLEQIIDNLIDRRYSIQDLKLNLAVSSGVTPNYCILLYRQLIPSSGFKKAIQNIVTDPCGKTVCVPSDKEQTPDRLDLRTGQILSEGVTDCTTFESGYFDEAPVYCNTGSREISQKYGFDPCCPVKAAINTTQEYYPRCERLKMCFITSKDYFQRYTRGPLPYPE